jgi:hypothetical protein
MSRKLDDLHPVFRPKAVELLARCIEAGIPVMIIDTLRTPAEHAANLAKGVSWTKHSKHLDGMAIDICPWEEFSLNGPDKLAWNADNAVWEKLAKIGESLGLRAGYRWKQRDSGHFEYNGPFLGDVT